MGDLNISRQMASALNSQTSKDLVNKILADGKIDGTDKENIAKLNAELKKAATADDGTVDDHEESLINALDNSGFFGTSNEVVQKNLTALQHTYQQTGGDVSFAGLKIVTEDGVGGFFGADSDRVLKLRDQELGGTDPNLDQALQQATGNPAVQNVPTGQPPVQNVPVVDQTAHPPQPDPVPAPVPVVSAPAAPAAVKELITSNEPNTQALQTSLPAVKAGITDNPQIIEKLKKDYLQSNNIVDPAKDDKAKLLSAMGVKAEDLAAKHGITVDDPGFDALVRTEFQAHVETKAKEELGSFVKAIETYQNDPSPANLNALSGHRLMNTWGASTQLLMTDNPAQNQAIIDMRSQLSTASQLGRAADNVQSNIDSKAYQTPKTIDELNTKLEADKAALYDKSGGLAKGVAEIKQVIADLKALKKNNPKLYEQQFGYLGPDYIQKMETSLAKVQAHLDKFSKEAVMTPPGPEMLAELDSLRSQVVGLRKGFDSLPVNAKTQPLKDRFNAASGEKTVSGLESAISTVKNSITTKTQVLAELETARVKLEGLAAKPQTPDVLKLIQGQLAAISAAEKQIGANQSPLALDPDQTKAFGQVLKAIDDSKSVSGLSNFNFFSPLTSNLGFGGFSGYGGMGMLGYGMSPTSNIGVGAQGYQLELPGINGVPGAVSYGGASDFDLGFDPMLTMDPMLTGAGMFDPMMSYGSMYQAPMLDLGAYKYEPPSLEDSLLQQAQSAEQTDIKTAINANGNSELLAQYNLAEKMLDDSNLAPETRAHLREVLSAAKLSLTNRGDELINGVKASELAKDLAVLTKIYDHSDPKRGQDMAANAVLVNEASKLLTALPPDAARGPKGSDVMASVLGMDRKQVWAKMNQAQQEAMQDLQKKADDASHAKDQFLDKAKNSPVLARILELEAAKNSGNAATADAAIKDIAALLADPVTAQQELQRMLQDPEVGGKLSPAEQQQLGALYTEFTQVSARVQDINTRFKDHIDEQIGRLETLKATQLAGMPDGPQKTALEGFYDLALADLKGLKTKVESGQPIEQADIVKFQASAFVRMAVGRIMASENPIGVNAAANLYRQLSTGSINMSTARDTLRGANMSATDITTVERRAENEAGVIASFGNEHNRTIQLQGDFAATHADAVTPPVQDQPNGTASGSTQGNTVPGSSNGSQTPVIQPLSAITTADNPDAVLDFSNADGVEEMMSNAASTATALEEVSRLPTDQIQSFMAQANTVLNTDIQGTVDSVMRMMEQTTQELAVENQNLERINGEQQLLLQDMLSDGSYMSPEAQAAVEAANALADELILSPAPKVGGEQHLSKLIGDFLNIIRDLDYKTRQLVLAQLARQMMTNSITSFYKDKQDKNNKYHEQKLKEMSANLKTQIEHAVKQAALNQSSSGQGAVAAAGGVSGVGEVLNQTSVRQRFSDMLKVTNKMTPPLPAAMQERILSAVTGIWAAGGTPTLDDDKTGTIALRGSLLGVSAN